MRAQPCPPGDVGLSQLKRRSRAAQAGLKTAIALLLDIEKTFDIRFANNIIVENTFRTAGALNEAVQLLLERQAS